MPESSYTDYHREYYHRNKERILQYNRERRELLRRLHFCRECGKQDAYTLNGRAKCAECVERDTELRRQKRGYRPKWEKERTEKPEVNSPRGDNGICWQCNKKPIAPGHKLCEDCYQMKVRILRENNFWRGRRNDGHPWNKTICQSGNG